MGLAAGTVLQERYRVLARVGEGGMGSVYEVEDLARPGTVWAIKELLVETGALPEDVAWAARRFEDEIALMRRLTHPRIPAFVTDFTDSGRRYFVMEFIPGSTLEERLARARGPLPERDVLVWMTGVCEALSYLHAQQPPIIVRDLKPGNVMITPRGEVRLIDLGIARTYKPGKRSNTENLGTMTYASPEHLGQSQTDARSDIYSLGATMYHLLTNVEPAPMVTPIAGGLRRYVPTLGEATEALVIRAMQLDPARRFQTASELREALVRATALIGAAPSTVMGTASAPVGTSRRAARSIQPAQAVATSAGRVCPRCGLVNRRGAKFCAHDGEPLGASASASASARAPSGARPPAAARASASITGARAAAPVTATITTDISSAEVSVRRATEAFAGARYSQTVRQCEMAISQGRTTYEVYLLLGNALAKLGRHAEAAVAYGRAVEQRPTADALRLEGEAARAAGDHTRAQIAFTRARQLAPRDADLCCMLGLTCLDLGQLGQAEGELRAALALRPDYAAAHVALGRVLATAGRWDEAKECFRLALAAEPEAADAHLELGRALLAQQHMPDAVRALEKATRLAPDRAEAHKLLGVALHTIGRRAQARDALRRAQELHPADVEVRRLLKQM